MRMNESFPFLVWEVIVFRAEVAIFWLQKWQFTTLTNFKFMCWVFVICENKVQFKLFGARGLIPCSWMHLNQHSLYMSLSWPVCCVDLHFLTTLFSLLQHSLHPNLAAVFLLWLYPLSAFLRLRGGQQLLSLPGQGMFSHTSKLVNTSFPLLGCPLLHLYFSQQITSSESSFSLPCVVCRILISLGIPAHCWT